MSLGRRLSGSSLRSGLYIYIYIYKCIYICGSLAADIFLYVYIYIYYGRYIATDILRTTKRPSLDKICGLQVQYAHWPRGGGAENTPPLVVRPADRAVSPPLISHQLMNTRCDAHAYSSDLLMIDMPFGLSPPLLPPPP